MRNYDHNFTAKLAAWLNDENRDYAEGALLLLRVRANQTQFRKLSTNPEAYKDYIFAQIKKIHDFRVAQVSHEEVEARVNLAISRAKKIAPAAAAASDDAAGVRSGKRPDHDRLPEDIKKCYVDNLDLMRRIADAHTKIRLIIKSNAECKDADLLPFADEIVRLDKIRLKNWKTYDSYVLPI